MAEIMRVFTYPQMEYEQGALRVQITQWQQDAVTTYVWLGDSNLAIAAFRAESFERALEILHTDTLTMLTDAAEYLRSLQLLSIPESRRCPKP